MHKKPEYTLALDFDYNIEADEDGSTQSEMQLMDNCGERWNYRYNMMLERKGEFSFASAYGAWMHASLEEWYSTKGKSWSWNPEIRMPKGLMSADQIQEQEYWEALGPTQLEVYTSHYKHDFKIFKIKPDDIETVIDLEVEFPFGVFRLKGMIDVLLYHLGRKGYFIMDHKTSSRLDKSTILGWDFRFQFMFYCWLARKMWPDRKIKGWIPNGIKKSQLVWNREKEGVEEHMARIKVDMLENPQKYFYREPLLLTKGAMSHFENEILMPKLYRIHLLRDPGTPDSVKAAIARNKNTDYCTKYGAKYACPYLPLCQGGEREMFRYVRRETKHVELSEELE